MSIPFLRVRILPLLLAASVTAGTARAMQEPVVQEQPEAPADIVVEPSGGLGHGLTPGSGKVLDLRDLSAPRVLTLDLTREAQGTWERIRRGFGMPDLDSPLVAEQQLFYLNRPGFLKQVFERGGRYLHYIVGELERRNMPMELALLPMVESSYNPMAYSRAHASGLWQFIPSTGRNYNLTQNEWVDERRDVIASTEAALDYLQYLYDMHGDWHLALASYNWGEGSVARAIQRNQAEGLPAEYLHLRMPDETRNYVPKLQALKNIVAQPELFDFELPYVANRSHFTAVSVPQGMDLASAARLADMPLDEFIALNPGFNRPAIASDGEYLLIPVDRVEKFQQGLIWHEATDKRWQTYAVKPGETLAAVARKFGLSLAQLRQINGLHGRSRVGPGDLLLVPDGADPADALAAVQRPSAPALKSGSSAAKKKALGKKARSRKSPAKTSSSGASGTKKAAKAPTPASAKPQAR